MLAGFILTRTHFLQWAERSLSSTKKFDRATPIANSHGVRSGSERRVGKPDAPSRAIAGGEKSLQVVVLGGAIEGIAENQKCRDPVFAVVGVDFGAERAPPFAKALKLRADGFLVRVPRPHDEGVRAPSRRVIELDLTM